MAVVQHIKNTKDFVEQIKNTKLEEGDCIHYYDVMALCTSVPVDPAINIIKNRL